MEDSFLPWHKPNLESGPRGESLTLRLGQETADFIEDHKDRPFLAYLSFYTVHSPIQTTQALWKKYRDKAEKDEPGPKKERFVFDRRLNVRQVQDCPIYAGMVEQLDQSIGVVLGKLEEHGLEDETIICFTSDNGGVSSGDAYATSNLPSVEARGASGKVVFVNPFISRLPELPKVDRKAQLRSMELIGIPPYSNSVESKSQKIKKSMGSVWSPC